jgi:hypothetical protein
MTQVYYPNNLGTGEHPLVSVLTDRIASGLRRKTITKCSQWACAYRVMGQPFPGPFTFKYHPWIREIHDCDSELVVVRKGAQLGYTEAALNKAFYAIDVLGTSVLYILPAGQPDASDFSTSRFDPALEMSPHLQSLFSAVKNIGHKRAGNANLYIRGSRSRSQLKSIPVGLTIGDEVDEMIQENIPLAFERMSGQMYKQVYLLSTPTISNYGIDAYYQSSSQDHYFFKCPRCSRLTELLYPDCLVVTAESLTDLDITKSHLICKECKGLLPHKEKTDWLKEARWISTYTNRPTRGYWNNQLYSITVRPDELSRAVLAAELNPADEQELYNSKLGMPHEPQGARITDANLDDCQGNYTKYDVSPVNALVTMGVDVGKWLHYEINQWYFDENIPSVDLNVMSKCRILNEGKVLHFEELDTLMQHFKVLFCVIDANPERRKALEFAQRWWGHVRMCFYATGISNKQIHIHKEEEHTISVDRTSWMDLGLMRYKNKTIIVPKDLSIEYKAHVKAPVRLMKKDANGNPIAVYVTGSEADHFAHARVYSEIALPLGASLAQNQDIGNIL